MTLKPEIAEKIYQSQLSSASSCLFATHQSQVIEKHNQVIREYRSVYKNVMTEVWKGFDRSVNLGSKYVLDENGEKITHTRVLPNGNLKVEYVEDDATSPFNNKGCSILIL